jgi:hypothetical protein
MAFRINGVDVKVSDSEKLNGATESATATANSIAKRDANGRMKAAAAVAADDVVVKSQLDSAAGYQNVLATAFPLATGGAVVNRHAVSINFAGQVGEYPVINQYGTTRDSASTHTYTAVSLDGSRAIWVDEDAAVKDPDDWDIDIYGYALSTTTDAVQGTTVLRNRMDTTSSISSGSYTWKLQVWPVSNDKFIVFQTWEGYYNDVDYPFSGAYIEATLVQVGSTGNVTSLANHRLSHDTGAACCTKDVLVWPVAKRSDGYVFGALMKRAGSSTPTLYKTITVSTTANSITSATDNEEAALETLTTFGVLVNNQTRLVAARLYTVYTATYATNNLGAVSSQSIATELPAYGSSGVWWFFGTTKAIVLYTRSTGGYALAVVTINQTTGAPTVVSSAPCDVGGFTDIASADGLNFAAIKGGYVYTFSVTGANALVLGDSGSVALGSTPAIQGYGSGGEIRAVSNSVFLVTYKDINGAVRHVPLVVSAFTTTKYNHIGVAVESVSSGSAYVATHGVLDGFTGLTAQVDYYVDPTSANGALSEIGDIFVGRAVSPTQLLLG